VRARVKALVERRSKVSLWELVVGEEEGESRVGGGIGVEVDAEGFTVVALSALFGFGFDFAALLRFEDGWVARGLAGAVEDGEPDDF